MLEITLFISLWVALHAGYLLYEALDNLALFTKCQEEGHVQLVDESNDRELYVECKVVMGEEEPEGKWP
ncbi:hypothetical protein [Pseudoalteromonas luteoviolacea]|uniref:hypothetical protein n=1 Tax=Pseudoalteromonas luteoviolacea TaxID=43657 RepID=UPI001B35CBD5|nr:hypothetical protein [Pseudoalteromonas luteoviolacea]MBQ4837364.1 hypothetical protein [Pseudoalteromonas luteoviolacea]